MHFDLSILLWNCPELHVSEVVRVYSVLRQVLHYAL